MLLILKPTLRIPSATTARKLIHDHLIAVLGTIQQTLPPKIKFHLCADNWSSPNHIAFMGVTVHFIDNDWVLREILIGFEPLFEAHTGSYLAKVLSDVIIELGIPKRFMCLTTDSASNNNTMAAALPECLSVPWDASQLHLPCFAHVINLVSQSFIGALKASAENDHIDNEFHEQNAFSSLQKYPVGSFRRTLEKVFPIFSLRRIRIYYDLYFYYPLYFMTPCISITPCIFITPVTLCDTNEHPDTIGSCSHQRIAYPPCPV